MKLRRKTWTSLLLLLLASGCVRWGQEPAHILVIAVDHLQNSDLGCQRDTRPPLKSGLEILCQNSVRFSHAFTSSPMTEPAMTTLLTGLYPFQHGVRDNGANFLSTQIATVARSAHERGWHTAFFSGGPPLLRHTGLQQGFDLFDDNLSPSPRKPFRSIDESFHLYENWLHGLNENSLAVIYLPDLADTRNPTRNELGEDRNLSFESQMEEFDFRLGQLFTYLQKENRWDGTQIVLVGLNGRPTVGRREALVPLNLHAEQTQVALLIKPKSKPRDTGLAWSFDQNVSLADVGKTLFSWVGAEGPAMDPQFKVYSLDAVLKNQQNSFESTRWIPSETFWGPWRGLGPLLTGLRQDRLFYLREQTPNGFLNRQFFTLTDNLELNPVVRENPEDTSSDMMPLWDRIQSPDANLNLPSEPLVAALMEIEVWQKSSELKVTSQKMADQILSSEQHHSIRLVNAVARLLNRFGDWDRLIRLGRQYQVKDWIAIAERNLPREKTKGKFTAFENPCLRSLDEKTWNDFAARKKCHDRHLVQLLEARAESADGLMKEAQGKRLQWLELENQNFVRMWEWNWALGLPWNLSESKINESQLWELAMSAPAITQWRNSAPNESSHSN